MKKPNMHFMVAINCHDFEIIELDVFIPQLLLELEDGHRPTEEGYKETFRESDDVCRIVADHVELCEDTILFEAIGTYSVQGSRDYWGEYDEETTFEMHQWSVVLVPEEAGDGPESKSYNTFW